MKRRLPQTHGERLKLPTIMERALAAQHGAAYVKLAAFAIDIDRLFVEEPTEDELPFGWEVFLTEAYLVARIDPRNDAERVLLEDTCLSILEQPSEEQGYGSQLLFAVNDAIARGLYPPALAAMFKSWRTKPKQLKKSLEAQWNDAPRALAAAAEHCLGVELSPEIAPHTRAVLLAMRAGEWPSAPEA